MSSHICLIIYRSVDKIIVIWIFSNKPSLLPSICIVVSQICGQGAIISSNTIQLDMSEIASKADYPQVRVFFCRV